MNIELWNQLDSNQQEELLEEYFKLESLMGRYATGYDELKTALEFICEWQTTMGKFNEDFNKFLIGVYPYPYIDKYRKENRMDELLQLSNEAKKFVDYWNEVVQSK